MLESPTAILRTRSRSIRQTAIYVVRTAEGFFALSAICTHLGCMTAYKPDLGIIACPCHGSKFNKDGVKIAGPAPQTASLAAHVAERRWQPDG